MSDTVLITLMGLIVVLIIFFTAIIIFRDRIKKIIFSPQEGITIELTSGEREAALQSLIRAEANNVEGSSSAPDAHAKVEEQLNSLKTKIHKQVLWVDDNPSNNRYEVETLKPLGIDVIQVTSNQEAYSALKASEYSLVLTDIGRTGQMTDGFDLVSTLSEQHPELPVIVYTSPSAVIKHGDEARKRGAKNITASPAELVSSALDNLRV